MASSFRIGTWVVHPRLSVLSHSGDGPTSPGGEIHLEPRAMEVLVYLAARAGEVVSKEEIFRDVWQGAFVTDESLTNCISNLRKTLGDEARNPHYIQTIPKKGYRLIAEVFLEEVEFEAGRPVERSPYPGLAPFLEEDAEFFFGREEEVDSLREKLSRRRLLALIGPSGAGKTSLLRAGLLPAPPPGWGAVVCQPGEKPFVNAARALVPELAGDRDATEQLLRFDEPDVAVSVFERWRKARGEAVLVVDQCEELFTLNPKEVQSRFAEFLGRAASAAGVHVLLSLRDDFLIHCHDHEALSGVFTEITPLKPPQGEALRRVLVGPAERCGYRFEDEDLVAEMLGQVTEERGALPLLAFAAARLWDKRDRENRLLTRKAYEEIGGVTGALAQHAEATLERIGTGHEDTVREVFRNLVTAQATRASRDLEELRSVFEDREEAERVLKALVDARLLTTFEPAGAEGTRQPRRIEMVHESLLKHWPRLVRWQTQDADGAQLRDQLRQAAQLWDSRGRATGLLWTGRSFREFRVWRETYPGGLTATEEAFSEAMIQQAERRRRRLRLAMTGAFAFLFVVVGVVGLLWQRSVAETRRADAGKLLALGQIEIERDPTSAVAYALKSLELSDTREARRFALRALQRGPTATTLNVIDTGTGNAHTLDFSTDGRWLAVAGYDLVQLRPQGGGAPVLLPRYQTSGISGVDAEFTPSGDRLVTAKLGEIRIYSVPEGEELEMRKIEQEPTRLFMGSAGFYTLTAGSDDTVVRGWLLDEAAPRFVRRMEPINNRWAAGIDPGGHRLVYGRDRQILQRSLEDWDLSPRILGEHADRIVFMDLHAGGDLVAALDASGEIRIWSTGVPPGSRYAFSTQDDDFSASASTAPGGDWPRLEHPRAGGPSGSGISPPHWRPSRLYSKSEQELLLLSSTV